MVDADLVVAEHRQGVFKYLCRVVGRHETARDLTQEVFLRVSRSAPPEHELARKVWVFRIARNLARNHIRDSGRWPSAVELVDADAPATQELRLALDQALATLEPLDRDTFLLRETGGLSYEEIASACDLTIPAVRCRLHRARQQLRACLTPALVDRRARGVRLADPER